MTLKVTFPEKPIFGHFMFQLGLAGCHLSGKANFWAFSAGIGRLSPVPIGLSGNGVDTGSVQRSSTHCGASAGAAPSASAVASTAATEAPAAPPMAEPRTIYEWLDRIGRGFGSDYGFLFQEIGIDEPADIVHIDDAACWVRAHTHS